MLNERQQQASMKFGKAMTADTLDSKTVYLVRIAAAIALGCAPWMEHLFGGAEENGVGKEDLDAVLAVVMVVAAGSVKNKAQEVYDRL